MRVDGQPYALPYFTAWSNLPRCGRRLTVLGYGIVPREGLPGHLRGIDHELTYFVLAFDSGYWCTHAGHTPNALTVRPPRGAR